MVLEDQVANRSAVISKNINLNSRLYCPHDLLTDAEFRDDLPTLLGNKNTQIDEEITEESSKLLATSPRLNVFENQEADKQVISTFDTIIWLRDLIFTSFRY